MSGKYTTNETGMTVYSRRLIKNILHARIELFLNSYIIRTVVSIDPSLSVFE